MTENITTTARFALHEGVWALQVAAADYTEGAAARAANRTGKITGDVVMGKTLSADEYFVTAEMLDTPEHVQKALGIATSCVPGARNRTR